MMTRHPIDWVSLLLGAAFLVMGAIFLMGDPQVELMDPASVFAIVPIALGVILASVTLNIASRNRRVRSVAAGSGGVEPNETGPSGIDPVASDSADQAPAHPEI